MAIYFIVLFISFIKYFCYNLCYYNNNSFSFYKIKKNKSNNYQKIQKIVSFYVCSHYYNRMLSNFHTLD